METDTMTTHGPALPRAEDLLRCYSCGTIGTYGAPFALPMTCPCGSHEVHTCVPFAGDVVRLAPGASYYAAGNEHDGSNLTREHDCGTRRPTRAVIDSGKWYGDDIYVMCFAASAFRPLDGSYVSCSGGPLPGARADALTYAGETSQRFWRWQDRPRAGGGVDYVATVALWEWNGEK